RAADVAYARHLRRPELVVIAGAAFGAAEAAGDPFHQRVIIDGKFYHVIEVAPALGQQDIERFGLGLSPRKAVEDRAFAVGGVEPLADQRRDDGVAHQLARVHDRLDLVAERRAARARLTQHVAS